MPVKSRVEILRITYSNEEEQEILEYLRQHIKIKREELGFSQRELSKKIDVSENFISRVESGSTDPSLIEMLEIARNLKKPLKYFIPPRYRDREEGAPTSWEEDVIDKLRGMKEEVRKAIIETIDNLSE